MPIIYRFDADVCILFILIVYDMSLAFSVSALAKSNESKLARKREREKESVPYFFFGKMHPFHFSYCIFLYNFGSLHRYWLSDASIIYWIDDNFYNPFASKLIAYENDWGLVLPDHCMQYAIYLFSSSIPVSLSPSTIYTNRISSLNLSHLLQS